MPEDEGDLVRCQAEVHRHCDRTDRCCGVGDSEELRPVREEECDAVARSHSSVTEIVSRPQHRITMVCPGRLRALEAQRGAVRHLMRVSQQASDERRRPAEPGEVGFGCGQRHGVSCGVGDRPSPVKDAVMLALIEHSFYPMRIHGTCIHVSYHGSAAERSVRASRWRWTTIGPQQPSTVSPTGRTIVG